MRLTILRHAPAVDREAWTGPDCERPLTARGVRRCHQACTCYADLIHADQIWTSPWLRALDTARIAAAAWDLPWRCQAWLGGEELDYERATAALATAKAVVLVGHEPGLGTLIGHLIGAAPVALTKCGLALLEGEPRAGGMQLRGLLSRRLARRVARD